MLSNWSAILNWIDFYTLACWKKLTSKVDVSLVKKNFKKKLQPIVSKKFFSAPSFLLSYSFHLCQQPLLAYILL